MDEDRVHEEYSIPLKDSPGLQDCPQFVYSVDNGTLPSNIRSVFLTKVQLTREYQRSRVCLGTCCNQSQEKDDRKKRTKKLWLIGISVVMITALVTAVAIWELLRQTSERPQLQQWSMADETRDDREHDTKLRDAKIQSVRDKSLRRTPCRKVCWDFSAFKFRSKCMGGFCTCDGEGYNSDTCLPDVEGCHIQADDVTYSRAAINSRRISTYNCKQTSSEESAVHVFSVFGMGDSEETVVELHGHKSNSGITVVLSSYLKVNWRVRVQKEVRIRSIVLMQTSNSGNSDIVIDERLFTTDRPEIVSYRQQSGYGDDREGGHTVQLLQAVSQDVGHITTFTGSKYADYFSLNLDLL
ncbi:uncharacterized protein [Argopecten irradians]|uniref:uncharacterized protein n=1 Tax=Argopecten irradians TaxID=31199 RepID=UPI003714C9BB